MKFTAGETTYSLRAPHHNAPFPPMTLSIAFIVNYAPCRARKTSRSWDGKWVKRRRRHKSEGHRIDVHFWQTTLAPTLASTTAPLIGSGLAQPGPGGPPPSRGRQNGA